MRENGGSLDLNFISLPKPAVDKNWVDRYHLLILGKIMPRTIFRSVQTLYEWHIYWTFPLSCTWIDFRFTVFICSLYRLWALINFTLCSNLVQGVCCRLRIFCITDAKYIMFHIGWCKSLKGSATPGTSFNINVGQSDIYCTSGSLCNVQPN